MYPTLYDLFSDLFGIEIGILKIFYSFGFFVVVAFLLASYFTSRELKRKESEGLLQPSRSKYLKGAPAGILDLAGNGFFGFIIGYKLLYALMSGSEFLDDPQGHLLSREGSWIGGFALGAIMTWLRYREKEKEKLPKPEWVETVVHPHQLMGNITVIAAIGGILGAKIFHVLENFGDFMDDPAGYFFSFSGLTMYGGLIVGGGSVIWYGQKNKIPASHLIDAAAPALMLAYGAGRIGCQVAGDGDWGLDNLAPQPSWMSFLPSWFWAYNYPHNVNNEGIAIPGCEGKHCSMLENPVYPTPLYEAIVCISLFFLLWAVRKKIKIPGVLFCIYLILNGTERFFIEKIRINNKIFGYDITQAEVIAVLLIAAGAAGIFWFRKKIQPQKNP
jgi:prolipoprotein diacylglyceryltransferase